VKSRTLMEYAGRRLITSSDFFGPVCNAGLVDPGLTCGAITLENRLCNRW